MTKTCAIIGCSPMCFPWGYDEEDEGCAALKLILINQISRLRGGGLHALFHQHELWCGTVCGGDPSRAESIRWCARNDLRCSL